MKLLANTKYVKVFALRSFSSYSYNEKKNLCKDDTVLPVNSSRKQTHNQLYQTWSTDCIYVCWKP